MEAGAGAGGDFPPWHLGCLVVEWFALPASVLHALSPSLGACRVDTAPPGTVRADAGDQPHSQHADEPDGGAVHHGRPSACGAAAVPHHRPA